MPDGTVLDGEILAWRDELPQPFAHLQRRLGRNRSARKCALTSRDFPRLRFAGMEWGQIGVGARCRSAGANWRR